MKIWDGTSETRHDLNHANAPRFDDYMRIVKEIQGIQQFLLSLTENMAVMPNLKEHIDEANDKLLAVKNLISDITPPDDLKAIIEGFRDDLKAVDTRDQLAGIQTANDVNAKSITEVQILAEQLNKAVLIELTGLKNKTRNDLDAYRNEVSAKFKEHDAEIARLNRLLNIKAELSRLS